MTGRPIAVACALAATGVLAGCGGSSTPASVTIPGTRVSGASTYQGTGWRISVPRGWQKVTAGSPGHTVIEWGDGSTHSNLTVQTLTGTFRSSASDLLGADQARNRAVPRQDRATTLAQTPAHVPGTRSAAILTVVKSRSTPRDALRQLVVTTASGQEYVVSAETVGTGEFTSGSPDGLAFVKSFGLGGGS